MNVLCLALALSSLAPEVQRPRSLGGGAPAPAETSPEAAVPTEAAPAEEAPAEEPVPPPAAKG